MTDTPVPVSPHRVTWILALIIIVAIFALAFLYFVHKRAIVPTVTTPAPLLKVNKIALAPSQVPQQFPPELLPLEQGATLTENFNASTADGRFQATRAYQTQQSLPEVITAYQSVLTKNSWVIQSTLDQPTLEVLIANKGSLQVLIAANQNTNTGLDTVTVTAS